MYTMKKNKQEIYYKLAENLESIARELESWGMSLKVTDEKFYTDVDRMFGVANSLKLTASISR